MFIAMSNIDDIINKKGGGLLHQTKYENKPTDQTAKASLQHPLLLHVLA